MPRPVHVLIGSSAAGTFALSDAKTDQVDAFTTRDWLSCGPLMPIVDVPSWKERRLAYWRSLVPSYPDGADRDDLFSNLDAFAQADEIVLWLGTCLAEQITLAWLPAFLRALDVDPGRLRIVQFRRADRRIEVLSLGMLNPKQISAHPPSTALAPNDLEELHLVWSALTAPEPDPLMTYLKSSSGRFPLLKRALRSLPSRYPSTTSGLCAKEMQLLQQVHSHAPNVVRVIGNALAADYDAVDAGTGGLDQVGDSWLFSRMLRLGDSTLREPALEITGSRLQYRDTSARLTPFGERILDGRANFLERNGIDEWVTGVHLQSEAGRVWLEREGDVIRR